MPPGSHFKTGSRCDLNLSFIDYAEAFIGSTHHQQKLLGVSVIVH
jgi:hypothetical protein